MQVPEFEPLQLRVVIDYSVGAAAEVGEQVAEHRNHRVAQDAGNPAALARPGA